MLRRFLLILAGALLITLAVSAVGLAETYSFGDVRASVSVPDDFEMVLTPYNLGSSRDWLEQHGLDHDALSNSFDEAWSVLAAAAGRTAGCTLEQCCELAQESIAASRFLFTPESLRFLKAGGRIGRAAALLGGIMRICPILTVTDGFLALPS